MKKLSLLLVTVLTMILFIGTTNAASYKQIGQNLPKTGGVDAHTQNGVQTYVTYQEGAVIKFYTAQEPGVDHYAVDFIGSSEYFDIQEDTHDATIIALAERAASKQGVTYSNIKTYEITVKKDLPAGSYYLADIKSWTKAGYQHLDCIVHVAFIMAQPQAKTCVDSNPDQGIYYDNDGNTINEDDYRALCLPHVCEPVTYNGETTYYDNKGNIVDSEEEMKQACGCREEATDDGVDYYNDDNEKITEDEYKFYCEPHICAPVTFDGKTYYYDRDGKKVDSEDEMNKSCGCRYDKDEDKYYDKDNKETTKEEYDKVCLCRTEDDKYFCKDGEQCDKTEFENQCPKDVKTGSNIPYIAIIGGAVLAGASLVIAKKRSKLKNI